MLQHSHDSKPSRSRDSVTHRDLPFGLLDLAHSESGEFGDLDGDLFAGDGQVGLAEGPAKVVAELRHDRVAGKGRALQHDHHRVVLTGLLHDVFQGDVAVCVDVDDEGVGVALVSEFLAVDGDRTLGSLVGVAVALGHVALLLVEVVGGTCRKGHAQLSTCMVKPALVRAGGGVSGVMKKHGHAEKPPPR